VIEIWVRGHLQVNGTASQPVTFKAWDPSGESDGTADWFGIFVWENEGAGAEFNYCTIKNAYRGIQSRSFINVRNCVIEKVGWQGISLAFTDSVFIENTTITGPQEAGLRLGLATARISNSTIQGVDMNGIWVRDGSVLYADNTNILDSGIGVYVFPDSELTSTAYIYDCTIKRNNYGVQIDAASTVVIEECLIDSNTTSGIYCLNTGANVLIKANTITNSATGIFNYNSIPEIRSGNVIQYNNSGIKCDSYSHAVVESTTITLNGDGVDAASICTP